MVKWWQRQKGLYKLTEGKKQSYCHCHPIPRKEHLQGKAGMAVLAEHLHPVSQWCFRDLCST